MNQSHRLPTALLFLALLGFGLGSVAVAATPPPPATLNVMVVDIQTLFQKSKAGQMVRRQIDEKRAEYRREAAAAEQRLNKEKEQLQRAQGSLSPAALNKRAIKFQQELNAFKLSYRGKEEVFQKAISGASSKIQQAILQVIRKYAKERKANLVFPRAELLFWEQAYDATDEVLKELDAQLPALNVEFAASAAPAAPKPSAAPAAPKPSAAPKRH